MDRNRSNPTAQGERVWRRKLRTVPTAQRCFPREGIGAGRGAIAVALEGIGLAQRVGEASWKLSQDHERDLRERQLSKDIIKSRARSQLRGDMIVDLTTASTKRGSPCG